MYCLLKNGEIREIYSHHVEVKDESFVKVSARYGLIKDVETGEINFNKPYSLIKEYDIKYENKNIERLFNRYILARKGHYFIYCRREFRKKYPSLDRLPSDSIVYGASWGNDISPVPKLITNSKLNIETGEWELL